MPTVQEAFSEMLESLGFAAMASDVRTETDAKRLAHYARIIVKQTPETNRPRVRGLIRALGY